MTKKIVAPAETQNSDLITPALINLIQWGKQHKQGLLAALIILVVAAVVGYAYCSHQNKVTERSWAAFYNAQIALATQGQEAGFAGLDLISSEFPGTPAAQYAQLLKGDTLYDAENFAQAIDVYAPLVTSSNETVRTAATLSQAASLQATQDYKASIDLLQKFIGENPNSFALPQAYLTLALSQELSGDKTAAVETYKHILESYTKSYFGTFAKEKLTQLQK
jgi:tetratricopeptide (TPR) repeat protein